MPRKLPKAQRAVLQSVLDSRIPESCRYKPGACATYGDVIRNISRRCGAKVYLSGGLVRDLVSGEDVSNADVDVKVENASRPALKRLFDEMGLSMHVDATGYFFVGCDAERQLEGHVKADGAPIESPANSLLVDAEDMTLIDPTGVGVADAKARVWRIPPGADRGAWIDVGRCKQAPRLLWRMLKFRLRGFSVPEADVRLIYEQFDAVRAAGKVAPSVYRNLVNQVPDPAEAVAMMVRDAASGACGAADVGAVVGDLLGSGKVWERTGDQGNVPFQRVCREARAAALSRRKRRG